MERPENRWSRNPYVIGACVLIAGVIGYSFVRQLGGPDQNNTGSTVEPTDDNVATALFADPDVVNLVEIDSAAIDQAVMVTDSNGSDDFSLILSTGEAELDPEAQPADERGGAYDVTTIAATVEVPAETTCMVVRDLKFGGDEQGGTADGFVVEVGESAWNLEAVDGSSTGVHLDASGGLLEEEVTMGAETVARSTPELEATIPIEPGENTVFFSIYDADNALGTSIVQVGNIDFTDEANCLDDVTLSDRSNLVALGDSFTSGFGLPPFEPGSEPGDGSNCQRSTTAYPVLLAEKGSFELDSRACQGALTGHLYEEFSDRGEDPQLDGLRTDTGVVVLTIGGNDTGWAQVLSECVVESFLGPACNENEVANTEFDESFSRLGGETGEPSFTRPYKEILAEISRQAPYAQVVIVNYPPLFADGGAGASEGARCAGILKADQAWMNVQLQEANKLMVEAAKDAGAFVVDLTQKFEGHALCESEPWFMDLTGEGPLHPTSAGHEAIAEEILKTLNG